MYTNRSLQLHTAQFECLSLFSVIFAFLNVPFISLSWLGLLPRLFSQVDSTPAASHGSAFSLASFLKWTRSLRCLMAGPAFGLASFLKWTRSLWRLMAQPSASPLFLSGLGACATCGSAFGLASFLKWAQRLWRLVARPLASPLFSSGLGACGVSWLGLRPRPFSGGPRAGCFDLASPPRRCAISADRGSCYQ